MAIKQIEYGSKDYKKMVDLRYEILRKPLGQTFTESHLAKDKEAILIGVFDEDEILACCVLSPIGNQTLRLRQMAVQKNLQGKGIGESIMTFAENLARDKGYKLLMMHARDSAIRFYEKFGYQVKGEQFTELEVPHHIMEKQLM